MKCERCTREMTKEETDTAEICMECMKATNSVQFLPVKSFTEDGFSTYLIEVNVIGIENNLYILSPGNTSNEAINCMYETLIQIKKNDVEIVKTKEIS